jgi:hypothetical protein
MAYQLVDKEEVSAAHVERSWPLFRIRLHPCPLTAAGLSLWMASPCEVYLYVAVGAGISPS